MANWEDRYQQAQRAVHHYHNGGSPFNVKPTRRVYPGYDVTLDCYIVRLDAPPGSTALLWGGERKIL